MRGKIGTPQVLLESADGLPYSASLWEVANDIAEMKRMSIPIVRALSSCVTRACDSDVFARALAEQLADEHRHVALCARFLGRQGVGSPTSPLQVAMGAHVDAFARAVDDRAIGSARAYLLCVATVVCTTVETVAFRQLARTAPNPDARSLFDAMARDEAGHFRLVSGPVADRILPTVSWPDRLRAQELVVALARIALGSWWPLRLGAYLNVGFDLAGFLADLGEQLAPPLRRLGIFFPGRLFGPVAFTWLTLCAWRNRDHRRPPMGRARPCPQGRS